MIVDLPQEVASEDMQETAWLLHAAILEGPYDEPLAVCEQVTRQAIRDNFNSQASPDNVDWPPRKNPGDGHPLLIDTGAMMQAATGGGPGGDSRQFQDTGEHVLELSIDGSTIPYAATHNYGDPRRNMPQREFFGMHEAAIDEAEQVIADFVMTQIFGQGA